MKGKNMIQSIKALKYLKGKNNIFAFKNCEILRYAENGTGLYRFAKHYHFSGESDLNSALMRGFYTNMVESTTDYEEAIGNSTAFRYTEHAIKKRFTVNCVSIAYYIIADDKSMNTRTEGREWNFPDGSFIIELRSFNRKGNRGYSFRIENEYMDLVA
jgi:hypothetical protein